MTVPENHTAASSDDHQSSKRLRILFWCAAIVLGISETWVTRHTMGSDGIQYLDMGDAYLRGDWHMALNVNFSPFYSWLLGLALKILKPSLYWEFPAVHLVNFVVFIGAVVSFDFLLGALVDYQKKVRSTDENGLTTLPGWAWYGIGYTLFLWVSFELIGLEKVTPDMCVAVFVYLAAGIVVRIREGSTTWRTFIFLGIVLGFGCLAKSIFFPLSVIFLAVALLSMSHLRMALPRVLVAAAVWVTIGAPFIVALSRSVGRPTIGEVGKYNYMQWVRRPNFYRVPANILAHPINRIYQSPTVIEFARPDKSTFPLWYEPSRWWEGYTVRFDLKDQVKALERNAISYYRLLFLSGAGLLAGVIVLICVAPSPRLFLQAAGKSWDLLIEALAGLSAFALILVEGRYVGPFVALLWLGILSGVRLRDDKESRKLIAGVVLAILVTMGGPVISARVLGMVEQRPGPVQWEAAQALNQMNIQPGNAVAFIPSSSPWQEFYWARLARVRIIAEIPPEEVDKFWASSPAVQADIMNAFEKVGANAVIAHAPPPGATAAAWRQLGRTGYCAYVRPKEAKKPASPGA